MDGVQGQRKKNKKTGEVESGQGAVARRAVPELFGWDNDNESVVGLRDGFARALQ